MSDRTKRLSRLGNSVVPQIAEWIGRRILIAETTTGRPAIEAAGELLHGEKLS